MHADAEEAALEQLAAGAGDGAPLPPVVSSAAPYALIVQRLLGGAALCRVMDDAGQLVGELSRAALGARLPVAHSMA